MILNYCVISADLQKLCKTDNIRILTCALCAIQRVKTEITYSPAPINPEATNVFKKGIKDLEKIMKENETHPKLQETIIDALKSNGVKCVPVINRYNNYEFDVGLSLAGILHTQKLTGWKNFMLGRWSLKWKEAQI